MILLRTLLVIIFFLFCSFFFTGKLYSAKSIFQWTHSARKDFRNGNYQKALMKFQKALSLNKNHIPALVGMGKSYRELGAYNRAIDIFKVALKLNVSKHQVLAEMGNTYLQGGFVFEALKFFQKSRELVKGYFPADLGMAKVFRRRGRLAQAKSLLGRLERKYPARFALYLEKYELHLAIGDLISAEAALRKAQNIQTNSVKLYTSWAALIIEKFFQAKDGVSESKAHLLELAQEKLKAASQLSFGSSSVMAMRGKIFLLQKNWKKASKVFNELLEKNKNFYLFYFLAGYAAEKNGNLEKALSHFNKAFEKNNNDSVIRAHLENFLIDKKFSFNHPLRRALAGKRYRKSEYYYSRNLTERAYYELKRALALDPYFFKAHARLLRHYKYERLSSRYIDEIKIILSLVLPSQKRRVAKYRFLLQKSIRDRRYHLYYQHSLKYPFKRIPITIHLKTPKISLSRIIHNGVSRDFIKMLKFNCNLNERFRPLEKPGVAAADYILETKLEDGLNHLEAEFTLLHSSTGIIIDRFTLDETGAEALDRIAARLVNRLDKVIPKIGEIIKIAPEYILINIGVPEKLQKNQTVFFYQVNRSSFLLNSPKKGLGAVRKGKAVKVDGFVTQVRLEKDLKLNRLNKGDLVVVGEIIDKKEEKKEK